jgi:hypothetical protein
MPRRKSELRIGFTDLSNFSLSKDDWKKLEKAYGRDIPERARDEIYTATKRMLWRSDAEHSRRLSESIEYMARCKKKANDLLEVLTAKGPLGYAKDCIQQEFYPLRLDKLHTYLMFLVGACQRAPTIATSLAIEVTTYQASDAWIWDLITICDRYKWPTGAAKDRPDNPSPFVALVWELQQLIPREYRRSKQSKRALAKTIGEVKRRFGPKRAQPKKNKARHRR